MFPRGCCDKAVVLMRAPNAADQAHKRLSLCRSIFTLDLHVNIYNITSIKPTASRQNKNHYIGNILIFQLKSLFLLHLLNLFCHSFFNKLIIRLYINFQVLVFDKAVLKCFAATEGAHKKCCQAIILLKCFALSLCLLRTTYAFIELG